MLFQERFARLRLLAVLDYYMVQLLQWEIVRVKVPLSEAKAQLTELVRRAEAGDEVVLTRHGHAVVRLVPVKVALDRKFRKSILDAVRASGAAKARSGPSAARSQDFLYGEDGLPR